jgi:mono/diheme cytochrome c family protein
MRIVLAIFAFFTAFSEPVRAQSAAQNQASVDRGRAYAIRNCAECHAVEATRASPNQAAASFREIANTPGMTPLAITVWLQTPHRLMPHIIVEPDDRDDLIAYITSLAKRD